MGRGRETKNYPDSSFSHNFCHWLFEQIWKVSSVVFYCWLFRITLKACNYVLRHYGISLNRFWSPDNQLKYLGKQCKIFKYHFFRQNQIMSIRKKIALDVSLYMRLLHQENILWICIIRKRYPETKNCPNSSFSNSFCHWNLNNKETLLFCF